jgi:hypothetical protein
MATAAGTDIVAGLIMQNDDWWCVQENGAVEGGEKQVLSYCVPALY